MANKEVNFTEVKNLRQWLDSKLADNMFLFRKTSANPDGEQCYNVSLMWDGTNYHISYTDTDVIGNNTKTYILPFTYTDETVWFIKNISSQNS